MPTYERLDPFLEDYERLSDSQRIAFREAVSKFIMDLRRGEFRKGLRIKRVRSHQGVWEMTWADDGRATFNYGSSKRPGERHVIWRRVGTHDILDNP